MGSTTPEARPVNGGCVQWPDDLIRFLDGVIGLNSFGMPNDGIDAVATQLQQSYPIPVIGNFAGFSVEGYVRCAKVFDAHPGIAALEANVGCGNTGKLPFAYDRVALRSILEALYEEHFQKPIWVKLSPYITVEERDELQERYPLLDFSNVPVVEPTFINDVLGLIWTYGVRAVVFSNTLANVILRRADGKPVTTPFSGKAGLSGRILRPISIRLIRKAGELLPPGTIDRIASGGAVTGDDIVDYLEAGAKAVYCTSGPFWSGNDPRFFADMLSASERLQQYLTEHSTYLKED